MLDSSAHHPEPFGEAFSYSSQRAAQMVSLVAAAAEVALRRRALHAARRASRNEQERRRIREQESADRAQFRARWAPAFDARWLAQADLLQVGHAWGAAAAYADVDPEAAAALRKAEDRLRTLHPYAMSHYDRLRSEGVSPLDAMDKALALFSREPHARPGQPTPARLSVEAGSPDVHPTPEPGSTAASSGQPASGQDPHQQAEERGREIIQRMQARALQERGAELSPSELTTALEESTSLPNEVITRLIRAAAEERLAATAERARAANLGNAAAKPSTRPRSGDLKAAPCDTLTADTASVHASADRTAAQLAAESFPCTATDGIRAAVVGRLQPVQSAHRTAAAQNTLRLNVST